MISKELQRTLNAAANEAMRRRHEYLTLEHLLFALLEERTGSNVIRNCGGDVDQLKQQLEKFFATGIEQLPPGRDGLPEQTASFERVIARAALQAQSSGQSSID